MSRSQTSLALPSAAPDRLRELSFGHDLTVIDTPNEPEALWFRARIALMRGDLKSAKRDLEKAKKIGMRTEEWSKQMAWIESHKRNWSKIGDALRAAGQPDLAEPYDALIEPALAGKFSGKACSATTKIQRDGEFAPPVIEATAAPGAPLERVE